MFPSRLLSTGGDELNTECYAQDPETQAILQQTGQDLTQALQVFMQTAQGAVEAQGKTPAVWEEMVLDNNVTLSNETVVLVWISSMDAAAVAAKNFRIVHAPLITSTLIVVQESGLAMIPKEILGATLSRRGRSHTPLILSPT